MSQRQNSAEPESAIRGVGLGLRSQHYRDLLDAGSPVPWLEVLADNYAHAGGPARRWLEAMRARYPVVLHGVGMSLGSTDRVDRSYLTAIRTLADSCQPAWISEHLAWTSVAGAHHHELLPLPFIAESIEVLTRNIREAQDVLGRRIAVENSAGYVAFGGSQMSEVEFVVHVLEEADCDLLLDVNNLYVNARNHGYDPVVYLDALPEERVRQMHLAGYDDHGDLLVDAHGSRVAESVWSLYEAAAARFPGVPACMEWDRDVPGFEVLCEERERAAGIHAKALAREARRAS